MALGASAFGSLPDRYRILKALGSGAMGAVALAVDQETGKQVAIKVLRHREAPEIATRMVREARVLARIEHPNLVRVYDFGTTSVGPFLVMEYVEGTSLDVGLGDLDPVEAYLQAAEGIHALHQVGVIHRDVKPANLLRDRYGRVLVADLGLAFDPAQTRLTETGNSMGTLGFMAPELLRGEAPTPASDWYAWGASLYEAVTGSIPFDGPQIMRAILEREPWPEPRLPPDLSAGLRALLGRCLSGNPGARPGDVGEIREILLGQAPAGPSAPGPTDLAPSPRRASRLSYSLAAAMVLGLGFGFASSWLWRPARAAGPAPAPSPAEDADAEDGWRRSVRALRSRVDADEEVQAALRLTEGRSLEESFEIWRRGRRAFRRLVEDWGEDAPEAPPRPRRSPEVFLESMHLSAVTFLLSRTSLSGTFPLFERTPEAPLVSPPGARMRTRELPRILPPKLPEAERVQRMRTFLEQSGRSWERLRSFEEVRSQHRTNTGKIDWGLRNRNLGGEAFVDTFAARGTLLVASSLRESKLSEIPSEIDLEVTGSPASPLVMALALGAWRGELLLGVALIGREQTHQLYVYPEPMVTPPGTPSAEGILLSIAPEFLPDGLRKVRLTSVGIQPIGSPSVAVLVREVHRFRDGPEPFLLPTTSPAPTSSQG